MDNIIYMHESTWNYLKNNLDVASQIGPVEFNGQVSIYGARIIFSDMCTPTINESKGYSDDRGENPKKVETK